LFQAGSEVELKELGEKAKTALPKSLQKCMLLWKSSFKNTGKSVGNFVNTLKHVTDTLHLSENQNATYTQSMLHNSAVCQH
jgi:hypothetical protein